MNLNQTSTLIDSLTAEKAAIGYLVLVEHFSTLTSKLEVINPDIFLNNTTREVFKHILDLGFENKKFSIDELMVDEKILGMGVTEDYIVECGKLIQTLDLERDILPALLVVEKVSKIKERFYSTVIDDRNPQEAIENLKDMISDFELVNQDGRVHYLSDIAGLVETQPPAEPIKMPYMPILEKHFKGGFKRGGMYTVLAPPGFGKTQFGITIAEESAKPFFLSSDRVTKIPMGYKVLFLSLEMEKEDLYWRILSKMSGVPVDYLEGNVPIPPTHQQKVAETKADAKRIFAEDYNIKITDDVTDCDELIAIIEKQCKMNACDIVIIDYIGLVTSEKYTGKDSWLAAEKFVKTIMQMGKKYKFANIQLSQFRTGDSRASADEPAWHGMKTLEDIEGGKKIGQSATGVIYLYQTKEQKKYEKENRSFYNTKVMYKLLKNRKGRMLYDVVLNFNRSTSTICEAPENFGNSDLIL